VIEHVAVGIDVVLERGPVLGDVDRQVGVFVLHRTSNEVSPNEPISQSMAVRSRPGVSRDLMRRSGNCSP